MRVFFALWPPADVAAALDQIARNEAGIHGGRATRQETIHLTLAFLGEVAEARMPTLIDAAQSVRCSRFTLTLDQLGYWTGPHVRWAGCQHPHQGLLALVRELHTALLQANFAVDRVHEAFLPHVTLVRRLTPGAAQRALTPPLLWPCHEFVLLCSRPAVHGSDYADLARFPLADLA